MAPPFVHGQLSYLQIPAVDIERSSMFYETVFGWSIERPHPSFDAAGIFGQWVTDRRPSPEAGPLLWLHVDDVEGTLERAKAAGAEILSLPVADGPTRRLATLRDPGGNTIGIVSHR